MISKLARDCEILTNKERFIIEVVEEQLQIRNKKKAKIVEELKARGYTKQSQFPKIRSTKAAPAAKREEGEGEGSGAEEAEGVDEAKEYNYLLSMPLWNLTFEKVEEMKKSRQEKENELLTLQKTHVKEIWNADLLAFLEILDKVELEEEEERRKGDDKAKADNKGIKAKKNKPKAKDKEKEKAKPDKKTINWDSESETDFKEKEKAKKSTKEPTSKKQKEAPKESEPEPNDIVSRVRRQMEAEKKTQAQGETLAAKPVGSRPKTLRNMLDDDDSEQVQVEVIAKTAPKSTGKTKSSKKGKRMRLDSDE